MQEKEQKMDVKKLVEALKDYSRTDVDELMDKASIELERQDALLKKYEAELKRKSKLISQQAEELNRRDTLLKEQEAKLEYVKQERDAAIKEIFQWTGCPACKHWDSADNWCNKHDRSADSCDGCSTPEWHGLEKA